MNKDKLKHLIEVNIEKGEGTEYLLFNNVLEKERILVEKLENAALIISYPDRDRLPFSLIGLDEIYWRKENEVFQEVNPDIYYDGTNTIKEIKETSYYKELCNTPIRKQWEFPYWIIG